MPVENANITAVCGTSEEDMTAPVSHAPESQEVVPVVTFKKKVHQVERSPDGQIQGIDYYRDIQRYTHEVYKFRSAKGKTR